ncbi:putative Peroxiredoxin DOT5 (putative) [Pseudozyma hubeiensis]|nr:putative Peroxiredoxin DOT5 (putative) [Pseudozyma hubeiensis]
MPLPRLPAFPISGERSILTAAGATLKIPAKEKASPLIGQLAPEISAQDHLGRPVSLHATIELGRPIVLYFFPLAGSPHCTKESCSFRDAVGTSPIFNDLNAVVIGISQDPPVRSKRFVDEHHLGFRILHDSNRSIMDAWGVGRGLMGLIDGRCTFIIDQDGIVRAMLDGVWDYKGHRDFAEKWLCRIEHELAGRQRFYIEHDADESVACDEISRNVKIVYGDAVAARGIATAPRHGAAPSAAKTKTSTSSLKPNPLPSSEPKTASVSLATEAAQSVPRHKSRRNLRNWLRPSDAAAGAYDEPLHVDYKLTNRSLDDIVRQRQARLVDAGMAVSSVDKTTARIRSLKLDEDRAAAPVIVRDFAVDPHSRQGSGSGSGYATPSTISAGSVSTGETSHTSPGPESHAVKLAAAIKNGTDANNADLERAGSSRRRTVVSNDSNVVNGGVAANPALTKARSSSLISDKRSSSAEHSSSVAVPAGDSSVTDAFKARSTDGHGLSADTVYANGNIARMPLLPSVNGEHSTDSMSTVGQHDHHRRSRIEASHDSSSAGGSSLPVPPRRVARSGAVAAAAAARLQMYASPMTRSEVEEGEDGYETDRAASRSASRSAISSSPRILPPQPTAPTQAPPPIPDVSPSPSFGTWSSLQPAHVDDDEADATLEQHRRLSNTPSFAASTRSESSTVGRYSPSLADSTHTFGWEGQDD